MEEICSRCKGRLLKKPKGDSKKLSLAEWRVYDLTVLGLSIRETAVRIFISESTVRWHLNRIYKKLGVKNRFALIIFNQTMKKSEC